MTLRRKLMTYLMVLALFSLACSGVTGLFGGDDEAAPPEETQAEQAEPPAETQAEAAPETSDSEAGEAGEQTTETEAPVSEAQPGEEGTSALEARSIREALEELSSYRWQFTMSYDGVNDQDQPEQGTVKMLIEAEKEPPAMHFRMELEGGPVAEAGGVNAVEMYSLDGTAYIQNPEDGSWLAVPGEGMLEDFFNQGFMDPEEVFELPDSARRSAAPEEVNGISAWRYDFDETDITDADVTLEEATGTIWVAEEGGYPIKFSLQATASDAQASDGLIKSGSINMTYELLNINADVDITLPEAALNAESVGDAFGLVDPESVDLPMMPEANIDLAMEGMVSYTVDAELNDVVEFYQTELANAGWTPKEDESFVSAETAILGFSKEGANLNLIVSQEQDGSVSVLMTEE